MLSCSSCAFGNSSRSRTCLRNVQVEVYDDSSNQSKVTVHNTYITSCGDDETEIDKETRACLSLSGSINAVVGGCEEWGQCSAECSVGVQKRKRSCMPAHFKGKPCPLKLSSYNFCDTGIECKCKSHNVFSLSI